VKADQVDIDPRWVTSTMAGGPITVTEVPPAGPVKDNLVAFTRAICGEASYPITGEDVVNNITVLEATRWRGGQALIQSLQDMKALRDTEVLIKTRLTLICRASSWSRRQQRD
jgi:hypothetical protein